VNGTPEENEIRRLLSKAWSQRRRKAESPNVRSALHLDLNREFKEERGGGGIKYFIVTLVLFALLINAVSQMIGLG
jgi:hypothetical protein